MLTDFKGLEEQTLEDLNLVDYKSLFMETKPENDIFQDYDPDKI